MNLEIFTYITLYYNSLIINLTNGTLSILFQTFIRLLGAKEMGNREGKTTLSLSLSLFLSPPLIPPN